MATFEQVIEALRRADASGNVEDAKILADIANKMRNQSTAEQQRLRNMPYSEVVADAAPVEESTQIGPVGRTAVGFLRGAVVKPMEAITQVVGGEAGRRAVAEREKSYQAGRASRGETGIEWADVAGSILSPATLLPAMKAAQMVGASTFGSRVLGGAAAGAAGSIAQPVSNSSEDIAEFAVQKIEQLGIGAVIGGLVSGGIETIKGGSRIIKDIVKPLSEKGRKEMIRDFVDKLAGEDKQKFINAWKQSEELVAGSRPTAAEAVSQFPESVNIAAAQERLARSTGGAPVFAKREAEQQAARMGVLGDPTAVGPMSALRAAQTTPIREEALAQANIAGKLVPQLEQEIAQKEASRIAALQTQGQFQTMAGQQSALVNQNAFVPVPGMPRVSSKWSPSVDRVFEALEAAKETKDLVAQRAAEKSFKEMQIKSLSDEGFFPLRVNEIVDKIDNIKVAPGMKSSTVVQDTFNLLKSKLTDPRYVTEKGIIDSRDLYTIRKEIGNDISRLAKEANNWDSKMTAGIENNIKSYIDNLIEKSGGVRWKEYLSKYADFSMKINRMEIGNELSAALNSPLNAERAGMFANAIQNSARTIKKAGGQPRFQTLGEVLTPEETSIAQSVLSDLRRASKANELAKSARDAGLDVAEANIPQLLNQTIAVTNAILRKLKSNKVEDLNKEAAELFSNPQALGLFMSSVPKSSAKKFADIFFSRLSEKNQDTLINILEQASPTAKAAGLQGAIKTIDRPKEEQ